MAACTTGAERDDSGAVISAGSESVFDLEVGDCWDPPGSDEEIVTTTVIPCGEPHEAEVYHEFRIDLPAYPGTAEMTALAYEGCLREFEAFVGAPLVRSDLDVYTLFPTAFSWGGDDRVVTCSVIPVDGSKVSGSMRSAGPDAVPGDQDIGFFPALGDCILESAASGAEVVDCAEPHHTEVYFEYEVAGSDYPGDKALEAEANATCLAEFESFVGIAYADSEFGYFPVFPDAETWRAGDRIGQCAIFAIDGSEIEGTLRGAGR